MTIFITSVSLLGLPAVTSVWGSSKISVSKSEEKEETHVAIPEQVKQDIPNCETCEYKNRHHHK